MQAKVQINDSNSFPQETLPFFHNVNSALLTSALAMPYSSKMPQKMNASSLNDLTISSLFKGLPIAAQGKTFNEFLESKPNLFTSDFQFPVAVIRQSALANNLDRMKSYCADKGVDFSPHVKTTMSPQIAQMQVDRGAWAITVANYYQANVFLDFGFKRILIANEILDIPAIRQIAIENRDPNMQIIFYLESQEGLRAIEAGLKDLVDARLYLFLEVGADGGRAGIRNLNDVKSMAQSIKNDSRLSVLGVSGFEGIVPVKDRSSDGLADLRKFCEKVVAAGRIVSDELGISEIILTAGGSAYFDIVIEEFSKYGSGSHIIIRSGGYVVHDHGGYELTYPFAGAQEKERFLPAIELWARVISRPEPNLGILNLGKRDIGNDVGEPIPVKRIKSGESKSEAFSGLVDHLNDQHGYLVLGLGQEVGVGDVIGMGICHPCTTFDKWRLIPVVNDAYDVVDFVHTFF